MNKKRCCLTLLWVLLFSTLTGCANGPKTCEKDERLEVIKTGSGQHYYYCSYQKPEE
jgi:hypothetical protein